MVFFPIRVFTQNLFPPIYCVESKIITSIQTQLSSHLRSKIDCSIHRVGKSSPQIGAFIESWVPILRFLSYQTSHKKALPTSHSPEKTADHQRRDDLQGQICCHRWDIIPLSSLSPIAEDTVSAPFQGATGDINPPSVYGAQLQMFADMEELVKQ